MIRRLWVDGRFSWTAIGALVFLTVSLLAFDFVWRIVQMRLETLLVYAALVDLAALSAIVGVCLVRRRTAAVAGTK